MPAPTLAEYAAAMATQQQRQATRPTMPNRGIVDKPIQFPTPPTNPFVAIPKLSYPQPPPQPWSDVSDQSTVQGDFTLPSGGAQMAGGSPGQTANALAGLKAAQGSQLFSQASQLNPSSPSPYDSDPLALLGNTADPFSEGEMQRMAYRDPSSVRPGSNQYWGGRLKEDQDRSVSMQGMEMDAMKGIRSAITSLHPAIQQSAEAQATRGAYPSMAQARGMGEAARAQAEANMYGSDVDQLQAERKGGTDLLASIQDQIGAIADNPERTPEQTQMLQSLIGLYNSLAGATTGALFQNEPAR